ncbi:hypothetical protein KXD40_001034 [Peronospora effusa]|nr:hypothetical protein KXD40_001034 [Peronospora effusa]
MRCLQMPRSVWHGKTAGLEIRIAGFFASFAGRLHTPLNPNFTDQLEKKPLRIISYLLLARSSITCPTVCMRCLACESSGNAITVTSNAGRVL